MDGLSRRLSSDLLPDFFAEFSYLKTEINLTIVLPPCSLLVDGCCGGVGWGSLHCPKNLYGGTQCYKQLSNTCKYHLFSKHTSEGDIVG